MENLKKVWIGAESIYSPLASTANDNFEKVLNGEVALQKNQLIEGHEKKITASLFSKIPAIDSALKDPTKIEALCLKAIDNSLAQIKIDELGKTLLILSTTKGDVDYLIDGDVDKAKPTHLCERILGQLNFVKDSKVISMACISGLLSIIHASDLIRTKTYDSVIVVGVDLVSRFTLTGFESFFALSSDFCKPYDKNRDGLNLGEAAASVILSSNAALFNQEAMNFEGGASANDSNHISGPSRTGEGLWRAIEKALKLSNTKNEDIDFISSHGTATKYNDDMESIAFKRAGLENTPLASFKGYFGHTLGAAGVLETALSIQSMRKNTLIKNQGIIEKGNAEDINVLMENRNSTISVVLKTASGFGGCNAAGIIKKPSAI